MSGALSCPLTSPSSFGLLHRIPPIPEDREPGAVPVELTQPAEEYEEHQLFVPADIAPDGLETPEQAEERMRWEHEQWERQSYARTYVNQAANPSPSAYASRSNPEPKARSPATTPTSPPPSKLGGRAASPSLVRASSPVPIITSYVGKREPPRSARSPPARTSQTPPAVVPRATTPTPTSPFGYHVNGDSLA